MKEKSPIIEIDGDLYLVDEQSVLTSYPPQYKCYRLSDKSLKYIHCIDVGTRYSKIKDWDDNQVRSFLYPEQTESVVLSGDDLVDPSYHLKSYVREARELLMIHEERTMVKQWLEKTRGV